jgi:hypothetical protein
MKNCLRCGKEETPSAIGAVLVNFICDECRTGKAEWHWGEDVTIKDMEKLMGQPENPKLDPEDEIVEKEETI